LRLALISHAFSFNDGQGRVNYEIARRAIDEGMDVTLVGERCADELLQFKNARFIKLATSWQPSRFMKNLSFAIRSSHWLKRHRNDFDVIQANGFVSFAPMDVVAVHFVHSAWLKSPYREGAKKRLTLNSLYQEIYTRLNARLEHHVLRHSRSIVAVSQKVADELVSVGVDAKRITVIFNGVDPVEFHPAVGDRSSFSLPQDVPLFLFAGDIKTTRKNFDSVLRAATLLDNAHIAVAGSVNGSPFPALAAELKISDRIHFLGHISRMSALMTAVDGFVFPSRYDPLGLVVLEAMAAGLPVITARTTGASAILDDQEWTLDNPEDVQQLARLLRCLADDPGLRKRLGERNRAKAVANSWSFMTAAYLEHYWQIFRASDR
jgi:glycosyltransferase involved in cell wall biosynthesis